MKVTIKDVTISSFRNIRNITYHLDSKNTAISGGNALGKTNTLNAIMWCLTGADLFNNSSDADNVPTDYDVEKDTYEPVDVEIVMNVGTIRRTATYNNGSLKETIYINDEESDSIKNGEIAIDSMLGILELSVINKSSKFNVRKFLLNPMYIKSLAPTDFRKFVLSIIGNNVNAESVLSGCGKIVNEKLSAYDTLNYDIERISAILKKENKTNEELVNKTKIVLEWLQNNHKEMTNDIETLKKVVEGCKSIATDIETKTVALDKFALAMNKEYNKVVAKYFDGIKFCLLEKGVEEDVWKNVCYPYINGTNIPFEQGSTSEQIKLGCQFVLSVIGSMKMTNTLPLLFDECETLDFRSLNLLSKQNDTQLITACVVPNLDHIDRRDF